MCLSITTDRKKYLNIIGLQKHPKIKDAFVVYKKLKKRNGMLFSLIFSSPEWKIGKELKSNRKHKKLIAYEYNLGIVDTGIHVYNKIPRYDNNIYVKCIARKKDLVAVSSDESEAVFMKIKPTKKLSAREVNKLYELQLQQINKTKHSINR